MSAEVPLLGFICFVSTKNNTKGIMLGYAIRYQLFPGFAQRVAAKVFWDICSIRKLNCERIISVPDCFGHALGSNLISV